ncbi:rare lipoprotein A [Moraxella macacae 0408225]|uniref:Endolytic peptidoglycan transglycosylase RlpA n=1 Tax=Moraxella macacae 0408225 TaxID=1230338 RepID=L2F5V3_9GAMM|nr:septal ring lytic transglycosylase RlpA family protein [Moraxella macacae]ELA08444.1 rare lipoprotein A [Moraxella macacae 0408225]
MLKRQTHLALLTCFCSSLAVSIPSYAQINNDNLDHILNELSRQHSNASDLVKFARQSSTISNSLAMNSQLLAKENSETSNNSDILERLSAVASNTVSKFSQTGVASWYGRQFQGKKTTSGDIFDQYAFTAAHRSLPMNCYIKVTNKSNGKSVVVKVNDRGSFSGNRVLDLSYAAAKQIGIVNSGTGNVVIERVAGPG